jgi:sugar O-acyltransferase (sialic acid O-acetyltransferase NeuD family)
MSKPQLLLVGAGGHANSCVDVIEQEGKFEIAGLIGRSSEVGTRNCGYEVIGTDRDLETLYGEFKFAFIAIGHVESAEIRIQLYSQVKKIGFQVPSIKSKFSHISNHASIGEGTIVMHNVIVNSGVDIGQNCILNTRSIIEHDVNISDHCHISTGAIVNGGVNIGRGTFIGSGSVIRDNLSIGDDCFAGMGTIITHDMQSQTRIISK